jgi:DNA-directed RNA polymerase specialized sigma24 family protein
MTDSGPLPDLAEVATRALAQLPALERQVLTLTYAKHQTQAQIAARLGTSREVVAAVALAAMRAIAAFIEKDIAPN